jgi:hypothetical protein
VCGEQETQNSFHSQAYLSLHKLVPVVIRKRSEKENEKVWLLVLHIKAGTSTKCQLWFLPAL